MPVPLQNVFDSVHARDTFCSTIAEPGNPTGRATIVALGCRSIEAIRYFNVFLKPFEAIVERMTVFPDRGDEGKDSKDKKKTKGKGKGKPARRDRGTKGKGADARKDRERGGEAAGPPLETSSGSAVGSAQEPDFCELPASDDGPGARERDDDDPPTLSDLAEQLRTRASDCVTLTQPVEPEDDESWPGGSSPWDLSAYAEPEAARVS